MSQESRFLKGISQSTLRQWRSTPTYFFLVWRWGTWIFALVWLLTLPRPLLPNVEPVLTLCLGITFLYTLMVTLYAPVARILISQRWRGKSAARASGSLGRGRKRSKNDTPQLPGAQEEGRILRPLLETRNTYGNIAIYCLDVVVCGLITYFSAVNSNPSFGDGSPFYRYGLSAVLVAGFTYSYSGGLLAALGYSLFIICGAFVYPPGQVAPYDLNGRLLNLAGSLIDAPLVALLAAFVASQLNKAIAAKREQQDNARRERALRETSEMLVRGSGDQVLLLRQSVKALRQGGHFEKLVIALIRHDKGEEPRPDFDMYVEANLSDDAHPDVSEELISLVAKTGRRHLSFDPLSATLDGSRYGVARLYQPFFKDGQVYLVIGAEMTRYTPFEKRQEEFLAIIGPQLIVALENIRLTEETATLATIAERGRIAREIHDGIAQLLYMLSLNSETCLALVERAASATEDEQQALTPVREYLEKQVSISKQALWETRHYMFTLQPLINGNMTLTQMLTMQLQEFEAISGLPVRLEVEGQEETHDGDQRRNQRRVQVGTAIFRITQEALTNAYKHAAATRLEVSLHHQNQCITVEIRDDGKGMAISGYEPGSEKIYSGRGLQGMRERAAELGGSVEIGTNKSGGTCVIARIPL
ncbi:MAG TPA: GAF domain-containing sensor histidine kinase [Ktedonobacteraceae bacterium]|nr:GAF domain-containing sensor histidine kinase [Ktedonobacteraceae bacterium]